MNVPHQTTADEAADDHMDAAYRPGATSADTPGAAPGGTTGGTTGGTFDPTLGGTTAVTPPLGVAQVRPATGHASVPGSIHASVPGSIPTSVPASVPASGQVVGRVTPADRDPVETDGSEDEPGAVPDAVAGLMPGALDDAFDPWSHRDSVDPDPDDIAGFHVEAVDGRIGVVDAASHTLDDGRLVVDIGHFIFGRTVVVAAADVDVIDRLDRVVHLVLTKEEVKDCPDVDADMVATDQADIPGQPQ